MLPLRDEVRKFFVDGEVLQTLLATGEILTQDERELIEFTAMDLLRKLGQTATEISDWAKKV